jgi:hypothetical protein
VLIACDRLYKAVPYLRETSSELISDALKMPIGVFTNKQKQTLVKWLEETRSSADGKAPPAAEEETESFMCVDIDEDGFASLLAADGTPRDAVHCETPVANSIRQWLDEGEEIVVTLNTGAKNVNACAHLSYASLLDSNTVADVR